jgi:hypothetical protein
MSCSLCSMLWIQVSAKLLLLSWHFESDEFCFFTSKSQSPEDFFSKWINSLLWQKVEVVSSYLAIICAKRNQFRLVSTLTILTEVKHICEGGTFVCNEEKISNIIVVGPAYLCVSIQLSLYKWLAPISWVPDHIFTIIEIICTHSDHQVMCTLPLNSLGLGTLMSIDYGGRR